MAAYRWEIFEGDKKLSREIADKFSIPAFAAHLLLARGITEDNIISETISPGKITPSDPMGYLGMEDAVRRITAAVDSFERIAVFGDYDVDGVTSTAMLFSYLENLDANVMYMLPRRDAEGYGLHKNIIDSLHASGVQLIITVDNGISAYDEVAYAKELGIDIIITDHHKAPEVLPQAAAIINPHQTNCGGGFRDFAGVGVVFKLVCALEGDCEFILDNYADLIALGTIADVVPLIGENRMLVNRGLQSINSGERPGINQLVIKSGMAQKEITANDVAFRLAPRLNAAGRLGGADQAVKILLSEDVDECRELAENLCGRNSERGTAEKAVLDEVWSQLEEVPCLLMDKVTVVCGLDWNKGVVGLAAARLCEALGKPCFVLGKDSGSDEATGSGRGVDGFSLHAALTWCDKKSPDLFINFGGHEKAAGVTVPAEKVDEFRRLINEYASIEYDSENGEMPVPARSIDCVLPLASVNIKLYHGAGFLEPFGHQNRAPLLAVKNCEIIDAKGVGGGKHQRIRLSQNGYSATFMRFGAEEGRFPFRVGDVVDCVFSISPNKGFQGEDSITKSIVDMRLSSADEHDIISGERVYEKIWRGESVPSQKSEESSPNRERAAIIYQFIKKSGGYSGDIETLSARLVAHGISYLSLRVTLEAMSEKGLIMVWKRGSMISVKLCSVAGKVDLAEAEIYRKIGKSL